MTNANEVTGEILLERAAAMIPSLRARGEETEELGHLPHATLREVEASGLFSAFVPKRYGGHEIDFHYPPQVTRLLARGCPASAWVISFFTHHNWQLGLYPEAVQKMLWADKPFAFAPGQIVPNGKATVTDGGYRLSGRWPWASGVMHANWAMLNGIVPGDGPAPDMRYFLVPKSDFSVDVDWRVAGLKGTGSNTLVVDDIFVPEERQIPFPSMTDGSAPGFATQDSYLWRIPMIVVMYYNSLTPLALGAAEGVLEMFIEDMRKKHLVFGGGPALDNAGVQMRIGRNKMRLDALSSLFETIIMNAEQRAKADQPFSDTERLEMTMHSTHIIHSARRIIDDLGEAAGASANYLSHPIQRFRRDLNALATHAAFNFDHNTAVLGRVALGLGIPPEQIR
jgi:3-hydroxy-9,10-secoandrosta-1,3,5(10)-triene-9,17-dione monooxygenase